MTEFSDEEFLAARACELIRGLLPIYIYIYAYIITSTVRLSSISQCFDTWPLGN